MSRGLSHLTWQAAYAPFTPSNSEQRSHHPYYRGCWHGFSRCFLYRYRQILRVLTVAHFFPIDRVLRLESLHHSRGVAASGFPPLCKIPHCCLPWESGPCSSASVTDHPLRPANHRRLGGPLPHLLANGTQTHPRAIASKERPSFFLMYRYKRNVYGISTSFPMLSRTQG